jgi:glyoxylase-like metal-dependent hydrolase (beta-lactamase superfamily II)
MFRTLAATALLLATALTAAPAAQDAKKVIQDASEEMGVVDLDAITYSGAAAIGNFGQSRTISFGLATTQIRNYARTIDFTKPASRATGDTVPPDNIEPRQSEGLYDQIISPATPAWADQMEIWITPWGFLRGAAAAGNATLRTEKIENVSYRAVTWSPAQKAPSGASYKLVGYINAENIVERIVTWVEHPIFGDMHVEMFYRDYRQLGGVMVPMRIAQRLMGMETFIVAIREAEPNPPDVDELLDLPAGARPAPPPPAVAAASERIADGVYRITGGYVSLAVEFKDHVVVLEGGQSEARGLAVIAEVKRLFPSKRIRYVVNTHPHFDHAGGLPVFVAESVTILTDDNSRYFVEQALAEPRALVGDRLAKSKKKPKVEGVLGKLVLKDEMRTIELHHMPKLEHSDAMLIAYLPKEKILFTADFEIPAAGQPPGRSMLALAQNVERLGLEFDRHIQVHTPSPERPLTSAELLGLVKGVK